MRRAAALLVVAALLAAGAAHAQAGPVPVVDEAVIAPVTTAHAIQARSGRIAYHATFAETVLKDAKGQPQATISATAYVRDGTGDPARRPVAFLFNGGPGASSSPLQFEALGPRRRVDDPAHPGGQTFIDSPDSLIDAADLVFIDPVGTGFSRVLPGGDGHRYWTPQGDADAVRGVIEAWLKDHGRQASPVYLVGESYGGFRLATLAGDAGGINVAGIVLVSPLLDASATAEAAGNDLPHIFELPSMAAAAWAHGKVGGRDRTAREVFEEARRFAEGDYALALFKGAELAPAERDRLAARMATLIGLDAGEIARLDLRVPSQTFLEQLVPGQVVGRTDTRVAAARPTAPRPAGRAAAADDPALGMHGGDVILSPAIRAYMSDELKVPGARPYVSLSLDVNGQFDFSARSADHAFYVNPTPNIATVLAHRPQARVLLVGGYFDLAVPMEAPRYALEHAGVPMARVRMLALPAGHSPFGEDASRAAFSAALHELVAPR